MTKPNVVDATIVELSPGGDGVALTDLDGERRAVFVAGVAEGERVRLEVDDARRPARGRVLAIVERSPWRVEPACPHVERCGGCDWMHLGASAQLEAHRRIVERILPEPMRGVAVRAHPAPLPLGYRVRARVHVAAGRSGKIAVGMFGRGSHDPVDVDACVVLHPAVEAARRGLGGLLAGARGRGEASLSLGAPDRGAAEPRKAVLDLRWSGDLPAATFARLERAVADGALGGARVFAGAVKTPARIGDPTPWILGADGEPLRLAPGGFSQASEEANRSLAARVAELAGELAGDGAKALELYAGSGNLTVLLARSLRLSAVESSRDACDAARANLAARALDAKVTEADASTFAIPSGTKLVVLDPPRTGAKEVVRALASKPPPFVVYVSCDPPTLGRDLSALAALGYEARAVETFEMFPQTSHVETVAALARARR